MNNNKKGDDKKLILLSAGGTGGHMFPADALAQDLLSRGFRVALATDTRGSKYEILNKDSTHILNSAALNSGILSKVKSAMSMGVGYLQARKLIDKLSPSTVVGFGGYPSVPAVYAAQKKNIPTIIHEQNAILGKANAFLAPKADRIALSMNDTSSLGESDVVRAIVTGNPVRADIAELYNKPYPAIEQDGPLRIFIMGGSLGASILSEVLPMALAGLPNAQRKRLDIVQQCRKEDIDSVRSVYASAGINAHLETFFDNVPEQLEHAHLIISRSGASTVAEVTAAGRPAIFVPYPHHKDQQQKKNADTVANAGGAWIMPQDGFTEEAIIARVETLLQNPQTLFDAAEKSRSCGRPDAARKLGNLVTALASGWDKEASKSYDLTQGIS
jgi:UDP-N-acetylglucosamine--N-acetylmuramyl-(pentapeptide) pyrophosphoryl-undecaprenol N-acetylglucosamine transferase